MDAVDDTLEEFLIGFEGGGHDEFAVFRKCTDEAVGGDIGVEGARVDIGAGDVAWTPDLAGGVAGFRGPVGRGHIVKIAVEEDEAICDVVVFACGVVVPGEITDTDTGLCPVCVGEFIGGVVGDDFEVDAVAANGDEVFDQNAVFEFAFEAEPLTIGVGGDEFGGVADGCLVPVAVGGIGFAVGFDVPDGEFAAGDVIAFDREHVFIPREGEWWEFGVGLEDELFFDVGDIGVLVGALAGRGGDEQKEK